MTQRWRIHRRREVTAYLIELREEGEDLRRAIASLQFGLPPDATQTTPNTYIWFEAQHWIVLVEDKDQRAIYVSLIEKAEEPPPEE
ncbi:MAG TPA: hypothetical protein PKE45_16515 [Caldilineaceae bacterium]|nr:hypothetical protein [Caldilineaceae bacterium]